ncbi:MAG: PD40 domain-containing protein [Chloroflexi bacterium]|nr:PD40 domain-containing protein [Chloroflexota bacterium]
MLRSPARVVISGFIGIAIGATLAGTGPADAQYSSPRILAPVSRQVGWLDLDAPRPQLIAHFDAPDYVSDVAVRPDGAVAAVAVVRVLPGATTTTGEILALDLTSGQVSPLVPVSDASESLSAPQWSPDGARLFFQREDVSVIGVSYGGGSTVQYPSRIDAEAADGSARSIVADNARQPAPSPDGSLVALVRRSEAGPALILHALVDDSERILVTPEHFTDIVSPRFSPGGDRVAFMAPATSVGQFDRPFFGALRLAGRETAMHGVPWDLWAVSADGSSGPIRLASVSADDGTVSWSPDGRRLFVYGGTGSFIVDSATGDVTSLGYVSGYGSTSWVAN